MKFDEMSLFQFIDSHIWTFTSNDLWSISKNSWITWRWKKYTVEAEKTPIHLQPKQIVDFPNIDINHSNGNTNLMFDNPS
jgi:hypothetical protein